MRSAATLCCLCLLTPATENSLWQKNDYYWLGAAALTSLAGQAISTYVPEKKLGAKPAFLPWDRPLIGRQNATAGLWSNILIGLGAPIFLDAQIRGHGWNRTLDEGLIYAEILSFNAGLNLSVRASSLWPRPEYHSEGFDLNSAPPSVMGSFYSGHASSAFALATSWYMLSKDRGDSPWLAYAGFAGASAISVLRVAAGKHYPSDIIVGALVGSGIGYAITKRHLHQKTSGKGQISLAPPFQISLTF